MKRITIQMPDRCSECESQDLLAYVTSGVFTMLKCRNCGACYGAAELYKKRGEEHGS